MSDKALISYNLMATLNSIDYDLFRGVYLPLFKRVLSRYGQSHNAGKDVDLQNAFISEYEISIPVFTVRSLLRTIERELSRKDKAISAFKVFENGKSFQFESFIFADIEKSYQNEERNSNYLESAFREYCTSIKVSTDITFSSFLQKYRANLVAFFSSSKDLNFDDKYLSEYIYHAEFLKTIEKYNPQLFEIAENTFLGSIIAAILESPIDLNTNVQNKCTYYLDTQLVLRALDLQDEDETAPVKELIDLLVAQKQDVAILSITLDEIESTIQAIIDNFNNNITTHAIRNSSIQHACFRRNWSQTDLQRHLDNFIKNPISFLNVRIEQVNSEFYEKCKSSRDYMELKETRQNKGSALHDVCAFHYVRYKRNGFINNSLKSKYWFVTANVGLIKFNISKVEKIYVSEMISPDDLTSLLWLRSPKINNNVIKIGLNNLIAHAIHNSLPNPNVINLIADNFKKYKNVSDEDYASAMNRLSSKSVVELTKIIEELADGEERSVHAIKSLINEQNQLIDDVKKKSESLELRTETITQNIESMRDIEKILKEKLLLIENEFAKNKVNSEIIIKELQEKIIAKENETKEERQKEIVKNLYKYGFFTLLLFFFTYLCYIYISIALVKNTVALIISAGGLWSFGNLIFNLYKHYKS